jgi:hypothetical protein
MNQGVVRLTLRVLDLVKTTLLKTLLSVFMEKISINKKVCFYQGITSFDCLGVFCNLPTC